MRPDRTSGVVHRRRSPTGGHMRYCCWPGRAPAMRLGEHFTRSTVAQCPTWCSLQFPGSTRASRTWAVSWGATCLRTLPAWRCTFLDPLPQNIPKVLARQPQPSCRMSFDGNKTVRLLYCNHSFPREYFCVDTPCPMKSQWLYPADRSQQAAQGFVCWLFGCLLAVGYQLAF